MSIKFASASKPERGSEFLVSLADIEVDHSSNNRFTKSDVSVLVNSINELGQLEAVGAVRIKPENKLRLAYGFGRYEAIKQINESLPEDQQMKIKVVVFDGNARDIFFRNLAENAHRNELSHVDYAMAIRKMSENFGQTDVQIASFFGRTAGWVSQHRMLLSLDYRIQKKVHNGEIAFSDALGLTKLTPEKQEEVVQEIEEIPVVVAPEVMETTSEEDKEDPAATTLPKEETPAKRKKLVKEIVQKASGKNTAKRSWNELYSFFDVMVGSPAISDDLQQLAGVMMLIMSGEIDGDGDAVEALESLVSGGKQ